MNNIILFITIGALWIIGLTLFGKTKMHFFMFLLGSVGVFLISMIFFTPFLERQISLLISETLELIGNATTYFAVFKENSIISFDTRTGIISMFIDYECSGVIEMLVFTSLLLFFPFGKPFRKLFYAIGGNIFIFLANIIRILMIVFVSKTFGAEYFYIAHTLLGRLLFFGLMIVLYYLVFTVTHLKNQHVGELK
ncbi:MAG: hypothetical protein K0S75_385 [Clostridia bacterium]|nr:hypothetical protein [Clostridia bacterium]